MTAHLFMYVRLVPHTHTPQPEAYVPLSRPERTYPDTTVADTTNTQPVGSWSATETVLYMLDAVREGVFYILVPDGETRKEVDQLGILWAAADVAEGRPALSRWHPNYKVG